MKNKLLTAALLLLTFTGVSQAQSNLKDQIKTFKNSKRFEVNYDRFKNVTDVTVGPFHVRGYQLQMTASFSFEGEVQTGPIREVWLLFDSSSRNWRFLDDRELFAIIDQERVGLGEGIRASSIGSSAGYGRYTRSSVTVGEQLDFRVPLAAFEKLAKGKTVDMKVGPYELSLKDEHLIAFRDLLSLRRN